MKGWFEVARNPADLYEVGPAAPEPDGDLVMLYYLDGFIDAGAAGRLLTTHLMSTLDHQQVAEFDIDSLLDYRSRRPIMTFAKDHWDDYDAPELAISLMHDAEGTPFLLLAGLEPDREWDAFTSAVIQLSSELRVRLAVGFHGIPMGVPHTRQLGVTAHAAQAAYPAAAATLLESVQRVTGLVLPGDALREAARRTDLEIARQVEGSAEVAEVVQALEQQYDAFAADRENLLAHDEAVPTAEELGAQFEQFLAEQQGRENPD